MGQYFKAVNLDKREYVCPWCVGQVAKLWEWAANPHGAIFTLLLRKSTEGGGGDFHGVTYEEQPIAIAGRWAGDRVVLLGDYDNSNLWDELHTYQNISPHVVDCWNAFIERDDMQLEFHSDCSCWTHRSPPTSHSSIPSPILTCSTTIATGSFRQSTQPKPSPSC